MDRRPARCRDSGRNANRIPSGRGERLTSPARTRCGRSPRQVSIRNGRCNLDGIYLSPPSNPRGRGMGWVLTVGSRRPIRVRGIQGTAGRTGRPRRTTRVLVRASGVRWQCGVALLQHRRIGNRASCWAASARGTGGRAPCMARGGVEARRSCPTSFRDRRGMARTNRHNRVRTGRRPAAGVDGAADLAEGRAELRGYRRGDGW